MAVPVITLRIAPKAIIAPRSVMESVMARPIRARRPTFFATVVAMFLATLYVIESAAHP